MNRRAFTRLLAAWALSPVLPLRPSAASASAPAFTPGMYGLGVQMARSTGLCSADMLLRTLALSPGAAQALHGQLIRNGILFPSDTDGMAIAVNPYAASIRFKKLISAR